MIAFPPNKRTDLMPARLLEDCPITDITWAESPGGWPDYS